MPEFYNATDAARLLQITERTVRKRIKAGEIPAEKRANERNVLEWQISAEWLHRNAPEVSQQSANDAGNTAPEGSQESDYATGTPTPEQAGNAPEAPPVASETGHRNDDSTDDIPPEQAAPERTGTQLAKVVAAHDVQLAQLREIMTGQSRAMLASLQETNHQIVARLAALEAAQKANEASRAEDARKAREEAAAREERIVEVAREHVRIKADNERLRNENAALKNRKWWQWGRG